MNALETVQKLQLSVNEPFQKPGNTEKQIIAKLRNHSPCLKKMKTECSVKEDETKADNYLDHKNLNRSNIISKLLYNVLK